MDHLSERDIQSFVFLDIETTSLPHLERNRTKILEICLIGVQKKHFATGNPRCSNKLVLCFNPEKKFSNMLSGLTNELLEDYEAFNENAMNMINSFLNSFQKPLCLVAHNGFKFDFPILRREIINSKSSIASDVLCVDSLVIFKFIPKLTTCDKKGNFVKLSKTGGLSMKLKDILERLIEKPIIQTHCAETDTKMLIQVTLSVTEEFISLANKHSKQFVSVKPIMPLCQ